MLFQPILNYSAPYIAVVRTMNGFGIHAHHEIEMLCGIDGAFTVAVNGRQFAVEPGQLLVIGSMAAHELLCRQPATVLLIELGYTFLQNSFSSFSASCPDAWLLSPDSEPSHEIKPLLDEIARECGRDGLGASLTVTGDLYRLCAALSRHWGCAPGEPTGKKAVPTIEKALELIYHHYREPLTVECAATLTGYGKSNFCRIFKQTVGMSFHNYLNRCRISHAEYFLTETDDSMESIAELCGFSDQKSFCRVFRIVCDISPTEYRRQRRKTHCPER